MTNVPPAAYRRNRDRGAALLIVMMVMLGLLGLGMTAMWMTSGNMHVAANMAQRTQALYAAEAGIDRAWAVFNGNVPGDLPRLLTGATPGSDNVPTALDVNGQPNGVGAILIDANGPLMDVQFPPQSFGRSAGSTTAPTSESMGRYTVFIRNDLAELRLGRFIVDTNGAVVIRSVGMAMDGRSNVVLEVTLSPQQMFRRTPATPGQNEQGCVSGKNACDDNTATVAGVVAD